MEGPKLRKLVLTNQEKLQFMKISRLCENEWFMKICSFTENNDWFDHLQDAYTHTQQMRYAP